MSFGFIATNESIEAVQRRPSIEEQVVIDRYRDSYKKTHGFAPVGLHYLPFPGSDETVGVLLSVEE